MRFQFDSLTDFIQMDGHGFYVWLAYAIAFVVIAWVLITPAIQLKSMRAQARRAQQLQQDLAQEKYSPDHD